ncbi:MAG TPA: GNAT family N-acetyltransferase [Gammaproteobacteria bacterium]|nr:GNAT family N-acetyltransferase [Gammaproteobacteria bacterium]
MAVYDGLQVDCIGDERAFMALREPWNRLVTAMNSSGVFLLHEWFQAAWQWARLDSDLHVLRIRRGDDVVGLFPLILRRAHRRHVAIHQIEFLSVPDTQYCGLICSESDVHACLEAATAHLRRESKRWDHMLLRYLTEDSGAAKALTSVWARNGMRSSIDSGGSNPYVDLSGSWDTFYRSCSRRLKKGNNLAASRLRHAGDVRIERFRPESGDLHRLPSILDLISGISARSWKGHTPFSLDQPGPGAFIRTLSEAALRHGWLSIWILYLSDTPVAMEYQIIHDGTVHALRADFDESYGQYSPGSYLNWKILESLFDTGLSRYYMGPGENTYKLRWSKTGAALNTARAYSPSLRGRALSVWNLDLKPALRRLTTVRLSGSKTGGNL